MSIVRGKSGIHYYVDEIRRDANGVITVVKIFQRQVNEQDLIEFYTMVVDLDSKGEIKAPGFTEAAKSIANRLDITLVELR